MECSLTLGSPTRCCNRHAAHCSATPLCYGIFFSSTFSKPSASGHLGRVDDHLSLRLYSARSPSTPRTIGRHGPVRARSDVLRFEDPREIGRCRVCEPTTTTITNTLHHRNMHVCGWYRNYARRRIYSRKAFMRRACHLRATTTIQQDAYTMHIKPNH